MQRKHYVQRSWMEADTYNDRGKLKHHHRWTTRMKQT
jgi:hypothetical protein